MHSKSNLILVIIWLFTGTLCIAAAVRLYIVYGYSGRIPIFGLMGLVSFLFAWYRNRQRKKG